MVQACCGCSLLPLERWRELIGYHPYHFWQLANEKAPTNNACNSLVMQHAWNSGNIGGRCEIENAIREAEKTLTRYLGYSPAPHRCCTEIDIGCEARIPKSLLLEGMLRRIGTERRERIVANAQVQLEDSDGDGLYDQFWVAMDASSLPAGATLDELAIEFTAGDLPYETCYPCQKVIRPTKVTREGDTIWFGGRAWLMVKPIRYEGVILANGAFNQERGYDTNAAIDPDVRTNFAAKVDIYREWLDELNTITLIEDDCGVITERKVCATICNARIGEIAIGGSGARCADRPEPCGCQNTKAQRVRICYEAGGDLCEWDRVIAEMATAIMQQRICGCDKANSAIDFWQFDFAYRTSGSAGAQGEFFNISQEELANPFGSKRGQLEAWRRVKHLAIARGRRF